MSEALVVNLSKSAPQGVWSAKAPLSMQQDAATIHLSGIMQIETIQSACRHLQALGFKSFRLVGTDWEFDYQYAFAQAAYSAKGSAAVEFAALDDKQDAKLEQLVKVSYWTRMLVNQTPEEQSPMALAQQAADFIADLAPDNVHFRILGGEALVDEGLVGIHGVGRGSEREPCLLELDFIPDGWGDAAPLVALVGKGITF
ncbi:MAG: aminopeptidase PepB, partial [Gammaproteobacteria bacterium]|nr:aminopeptidase PepB [Gammaproteobacteria bacterium]